MDAFEIALFGAVLASVWRIQDLLPLLAKLRFPIITTLAAYALFFIDGDRRRRLRELVRQPVFRLATLILVLMVVGVPFGLYPRYSLSFILDDHIKTFLLMLLVAASIRGPQDEERLVALNLFGATVFCIWAVLYGRMYGDRFAKLAYYDANDLGMLLAMVVPFGVYFFRDAAKRWQRVAGVAATGLMVFVLMRTGSRGGFLGLVGVAVVMLTRFRQVRARTRIAAVAMVFAVLVLGGSDRYWEMMRSILHPTEDYNYTAETGRVAVWKRGLGYMAGRPIFGVGASAFRIAEGTISPLAKLAQESNGGVRWMVPHNSYIQVGAELGVPGLVAFVLMLVRAGQGLRRVGRLTLPPERLEPALAGALASSLVGYCIAGFFLTQANAPILYCVLAMVIGLLKFAPAPVVAPGIAKQRFGRHTRPMPLQGVPAHRGRMR